MISISSSFAQILRDWMTAQRIEDVDLNAQLGSLATRDRVDIRVWSGLLQRAQALRPAQPVGLQIGAQVKIRHTGVLGYLVLNSESLGDALETYLLCEKHFYRDNLARLDVTDTRWQIAWPQIHGQETELPAQVALSALVTFMRQRFPDSCVIKGVDLTGPVPANGAVFENFFGCPVSFAAQALSVSFDRRSPDTPVSEVIPGAFRRLRQQQIQAFDNVIKSSDPFLRRLQQITLRLLPEGRISLAAVASEFDCSERTVQRKLGHYHLSYQHLLDGVREQLALKYLQRTSLSLTEISMLLGFSEQSAFNRAFKHWTGSTPGEYCSNTGLQGRRRRRSD